VAVKRLITLIIYVIVFRRVKFFLFFFKRNTCGACFAEVIFIEVLGINPAGWTGPVWHGYPLIKLGII
jgi:hypothetical protein